MTLQRPETPVGRKPLATIARRRGDAARPRGLGEGSTITVKGSPATAAQRAAIDAVLTEGYRLGCSRRVLVALIMCITQESNAGDPAYKGRGDAARSDTIGTFQQGPEWISRANVMNDTLATQAFLLGHEAPSFSGTDRGKPGWKQTFGGLKAAPGDLASAIQQVQRSAPQYNYLLARWEPEATRTVNAWLGRADILKGELVIDQRYEFTRGNRDGQVENSWDASGRLAEEVAFHRWAVGNVLHYVSDFELRAGAPSVAIDGDEPWLVKLPSWEWGSARAVTEVTIRVLAERWTVMPGGLVVLNPGLGPMQGRWIVASVRGDRLDSPELEVVLRRPTRSRPEPANDTETINLDTNYDPDDTSVGADISTDGGAKGIVEQAFIVAKRAGGRSIYVGSGYRPGSITTTGNLSDHAGNDATRAARDIGVRGIDLITGPPSPKLDKAVVAIGVAFGRNYGDGARTIVDTFTWQGFQVQIIWRTPAYGGHMGHIHVGAHRA